MELLAVWYQDDGIGPGSHGSKTTTTTIQQKNVEKRLGLGWLAGLLAAKS